MERRLRSERVEMRAARVAWRSFVALGIGLGGLVAGACEPNALVALPSNASRWIDDYAAAATRDGVTVEAWTRRWPGRPLDVGERATPVFVRIDNAGDVPLRLSRDAFALVTGTRRFRALAPAPFGAADQALPTGTLAPGASASGIVLFEPVVGRWGFVDLRTSIVDATTGALVGSLDVPFASGRRDRCARPATNRAEPYEDGLFPTCLP